MAFALVTGASKGIGKAIAENLAAKSYSLLLVARNLEALEEVSRQLTASHNIEVRVLSIDLSLPAAPKEVFDWCATQNITVSVLVNNAGYGLSGPFESYPVEQHLNMIQLNCSALVHLTYLFLPQLKAQPKAHILNIASSAAYQAVPYLSLYAASKAMVLSFSRGLRHELRKTTVVVSCVCPGSTDTYFNVRANVGAKAMKTAQKVMMTPEQVGKAAVEAMLSGKAEVITGVINKVGGALTWLLPKSLSENIAAGLYEE